MLYVILGLFFCLVVYATGFFVYTHRSVQALHKSMQKYLDLAKEIVDRTKPQLILADWETLDQLKSGYREVHKACKDLAAKELKVSTTLNLPNGEEVGELPEKVRILTAAIADMSAQFDDFKKFVTQIRGR